MTATTTRREWRRGYDVRGAHDYIPISRSVQVIRRPLNGKHNAYVYECHQWDQLTEQFAPHRQFLHGPVEAIRYAKQVARGLGETPIGVK